MRYIQTSALLSGTKGIPILMPSLSPTMTEGTIIKWVKKEGDPIGAGDLICEVQTDKAVVGLELEEEGVLAKILVPNDTKDIKIGTLIGLMVEEGQDWKDVDMPADVSAPTQKTGPQTSAVEDKKKTETTGQSGHLMGPSVRNLLHHFAIDSSAVPTTGPHNTLLKADVLQYIKDNELKPKDLTQSASDVSPKKTQPSKSVPKSAEYMDIEVTNMRKTIAKRMTHSKSTIPYGYMSADFVLNGVNSTRKQLKESGIGVSVNDFVIKASAIALKKVPQINSSWNDSTSSIRLSPTVDISVAVAIPNGLITPIVKNANELDLQTIGQRVRELAGKAKEGKLQPEEFMGGSFSVSNLGMFGISHFTAVINPPQSAILAVGSSRLTLDESDRTLHVVTVNLSYDARVIDDETAAKFLEVFKATIEDPIALQSSDGTDCRQLNALIS